MDRSEAMKLIDTAQAVGSARGWDLLDKLLYLVDLTTKAEREACAKLCDVTPPYPFRPSIEAAHAIRQRAQSTPQPPAPPADHP